MYEEPVEARLRSLMQGLEGQVRSCLESCGSPQERLLLLEFMRLPGAQITASEAANSHRDSRKPSGASSFNLVEGRAAANKPIGATRTPPGLTWLEWWAHSKVFENETTSSCCRLIPKFPVKTGEAGEFYIDFALFWPRASGVGHHKIAILCSNDQGETKTALEETRLNSLHEQGWIVIRLPESEIFEDPSRIVRKIRDIATEENVRNMRERRTGH